MCCNQTKGQAKFHFRSFRFKEDCSESNPPPERDKLLLNQFVSFSSRLAVTLILSLASFQKSYHPSVTFFSLMQRRCQRCVGYSFKLVYISHASHHLRTSLPVSFPVFQLVKFFNVSYRMDTALHFYLLMESTSH